MERFCIIIENDEFQHKSEDYSCESKRVMELFQDLGNRPLVLIRFNPDSYINEDGEKVEGCFIPVTKSGVKRYYDINEEEWQRRIDVLFEVLYNSFQTKDWPEKELNEIVLFYDEIDSNTESDDEDERKE